MDLISAMTALGKLLKNVDPTANAAHFQAIDDHLTAEDVRMTTAEATEAANSGEITKVEASLNAFINEVIPPSSSGSGSSAGTSSSSGSGGSPAPAPASAKKK